MSNLLHRNKHALKHKSNKGVGVLSGHHIPGHNDENDTDDDNDNDESDENKDRMLIFIGSLTVPGILSTEDLISDEPSTLTTLNGSQISVSYHDDKLWLSNHSYIVYGNVACQSGLIHIVSDVPYTNQDQTLIQNVNQTNEKQPNKTTTTQPRTEAICLDNVGLVDVQTSLSNMSSNNTSNNRTLNINGLTLLLPKNMPQCPSTDKLCYVARLSSSCGRYYGNESNTNNNTSDNTSNNNKRSVEVRPQCYNPNTHDCINNITLCPKGLHACGEHCYSSSSYVCITSFSLCPTSHPLSCGSACYNSNQYSCVNNNLIQNDQMPQKTQKP